MDTDEQLQLKRDVVSWEDKCKLDDANKLQKLYLKLHEGIAFRIASPFILVFLKRWFDDMLNGKPEREEYLD
ncbi:hypothetical protein [Tenacibaculum ovolyticum]|nr:hypothetical protein [Tenacibaculum ovolyticum]